MYNIAVCDDEVQILDYVDALFKKNYGSRVHTVMFSTAFSAVDYICDVAKGRIDVLMLDIDLNGESGIETAELIKQRYPHIKIVFFTGHIEYVSDIFEAEPCFFILKPISEQRFVQAVDKALSLIQLDRQSCISITTRGEIRNIQLSRLRFAENKNRTLIIREQNTDYEVHMKLNDLQKMLPDHFFRCHQSYIVNLMHIRELTITGAQLYSGENIPISRSRYSDTKKAFLHFLQSNL